MRRRGVSLLEVMFSLGVIAIGLSGVIAILPIALNQVGKGTVLDHTSRVGLNAVEEFELRGMARWDQWMGVNRATATPLDGTAVGNPQTATGLLNGPRTAFAIDPWFLAANVSDPDADRFPYGPASTDPRMHRISLRKWLGANEIMSEQQAEYVFLSQDDLVLDIPKDKSRPPVQQFSNAMTKRQQEGTVSWMATIAPKLDVSANFRDSYILSVVVFYKRSITDTTSERVADVAYYDTATSTTEPAFYSSGYAGGEVTLRATSVDTLGTQSGDWIMLMDYFAPGTTLSTPFFRWYRVVDTAEDPRVVDDSSTAVLDWEQDVTLMGPDWPTSLAANDPPTTKAVLVRNVIAVYEKTIRLETNNLWSY